MKLLRMDSMTEQDFSLVLSSISFKSMMLWDRTCADFHYQPKTQSSPSTMSPGPRDAVCVMSPAYFMHVDRVFGWLRLQTETQSELLVNNSEMSPTSWGTMPCIRDEQQVCVWHEQSQRERKSSGAANESGWNHANRDDKVPLGAAAAAPGCRKPYAGDVRNVGARPSCLSEQTLRKWCF